MFPCFPIELNLRNQPMKLTINTVIYTNHPVTAEHLNQLRRYQYTSSFITHHILISSYSSLKMTCGKRYIVIRLEDQCSGADKCIVQMNKLFTKKKKKKKRSGSLSVSIVYACYNSPIESHRILIHLRLRDCQQLT